MLHRAKHNVACMRVSRTVLITGASALEYKSLSHEDANDVSNNFEDILTKFADRDNFPTR